MLNWMAKVGRNVTEESVGTTTDTKTKNKNTNSTTGTEITDKINNIFDLRGNSWDFTMEARGGYWRGLRGGPSNADNYFNYPACYRITDSSGNPTDTSSIIGTRLTLTIN